MRFRIVFTVLALSSFALVHSDASRSEQFNETLATASLRGNRLVHYPDAADRRVATGTAAVASSTTNDEVKVHPPSERILQQQSVPSFVPLACNKDPCAGGNKTWKAFNPPVGQLVVIPCGVCITMDYDRNDMNANITTNGFYLKLPQGLEIQGSLIFPDRTRYRLTIETPSVVVQGNLRMKAGSSPVTGQPLVRFILTGDDQRTFTPIGSNAMACAVVNSSGKLVAGDCAIGAKPFVVAGGQIDVRGLPTTCKTWVKLEDIATTKTTSSECAVSNLISNGGGDLHATNPFPHTIGASVGLPTSTARLSVSTVSSNRVFRIDGRGSDKDSIIHTLASPKCFVRGAHLNLQARVRILSSTAAVASKMGYRISYREGSSTTPKSLAVYVATCPSSKDTWVQCEADFIFVENIIPENIEQIRLFFETVNAPTVSIMVDDWKLKVVSPPQATLLVPAEGVGTCWSKGAEILITSHTTRMEDAQLRRLVKSPYSLTGDNGLVRLDLDQYIVPPVTARQDKGFEVEVALLSRNIVLEGATDEADSLMGGHFMVMNTPKVVQVIEGIEFDNFGRQGELGRYPIHLHMCQNSPSLVSKNLIRNSNQRCVVIHGTHNATVFGNVAYNTAGHCFMTEDGGEIDNIFEANLGAATVAAVRLVRTGETDVSTPTTFWSSNPMNEWVGNVAAGSTSLGFWFELQETVRLPTLLLATSKNMNPRTLPLTKFVNNVAHSNAKHGLRTYPNGMFPSKTAIVENFRSYKNQGGFLLRHTGNFLLKGGVLADNRFGCDMAFLQNVTMDGMKVIGLSDRFREIIDTQDASYAPDRVVGLELHSLSQQGAAIGATIRNVQFLGFENFQSESKALIQIDADVTEPGFGNYDSYTRMAGITVPDAMAPFHFDFNEAVDMGIAGVYLIDLDGSMNPSGGSPQGVSTVIADTADMKAFVDMRLCASFPQFAYLYCKQTCLRTITFAIDPAETDGMRLRMTDLKNSSKSFLYRGGSSLVEVENTDVRKHRIFAAALPPGSYQAEFVRSPTGLAIWPSFVETTLKLGLCSNALVMGNVAVVQKAPSAAQCASLIRNGNMEESDTDHLYWLQSQAGITLVKGKGLDGSNAISTLDSSSSLASLSQFIDVRCLERGAMYDVRAWVRLELSNGNVFSCNGIAGCPAIRLRMRTPVDAAGTDFRVNDTMLAMEFVQPYNVNSGWNLLQGTLTVTAPLAAASSVRLSVERGRSNIKMFVDNVSMTSITQNCTRLVFNGGFGQGTSINWGRSQESSELAISTRLGNHALQLSNRKATTDSISQNIATGCMTKGDVYLVQARIRVLGPNGSDFDCNPVAAAGDDKACPRMRLRSTMDVGLASATPSQQVIAQTEHGIITESNGDVWRTMGGIFSASKFDELADESVLLIDGVHPQNDIIVDTVSITPLALNCSQLIRNGNAEAGPTAQFWESFGGNQKVKVQVIRLGGTVVNHGFFTTGRTGANDGPAQSIDPRCMKESSTWTFSAKVKVVASSTGIPTKCEVADPRIAVSCPMVRVSGYVSGMLKEEKQYSMTNTNIAWIANDMNTYVVNNIPVSAVLAACDKVVVSFRLNPAWDLLIDTVAMKPSV